MAIGTDLPPWLNVGPTDFLHAVQAGGAAGLGIAEAQNRAREAAARTAEAQRAAAQQQWEFGERMRQAAEEHAAENALRQQQLQQQGEYQTGMLGYHNKALQQENAYKQGVLGENIAHHTTMEQISADKAANALESGGADIVTHPEAPGMLFLRNPSGAESVIERPEKELTPAQKATFALKAFNAFKPLSSDEDIAGPMYQSRTNYAGNLLREMGALPNPQFGSEAWKGILGQPSEGSLFNLAPTTEPEPPSTEQQSGTPVITSKAEFDVLPRGSVYINKGKTYRKP